jgi:ABC-type sugar transport system ATPase subunit
MLTLDDISIQQGRFRLEHIAFTVPRGCYAVLMGKTGCGKTTLLEAIAGLRPVASGRILLGGVDVTNLPPAARDLGYVPQDGALFRTMTVRDNLAFALDLHHVPAGLADERVRQLAGWLQIEPLLERRAVGLSGGETQRVALGRALAYGPPLLLLDEPLSALDEDTRARLVALLRGIRQRGRVTVLHVTHSRHEARLLGDVILRLQAGRIEVVRPLLLSATTDRKPIQQEQAHGPLTSPLPPLSPEETEEQGTPSSGE